ncbi:hypothetical protein EJB05_42139, partial [Eragrostis curvula]
MFDEMRLSTFCVSVQSVYFVLHTMSMISTAELVRRRLIGIPFSLCSSRMYKLVKGSHEKNNLTREMKQTQTD